MRFFWMIQNLSYLEGKELQSPSFNGFNESWELIVYPNGDKQVRLRNLDKENFSLHCSYSFLDFKGHLLEFKERGISRDSCVLQNIGFIPNFIPNNTLIVECRLYNTFAELIESDSYFALARIEPPTEVVEKTFDCNLPYEASTQEFIFKHVEQAIGNDNFLTIKVSENKNQDNSFEVTFNVSMSRSLMKVKIFLLKGIPKKGIPFVNFEYNFQKRDDEFTVNTNITKNMIMSNQNLFLPDDILSLRFMCTFSENVIFNNRLMDENEFTTNCKKISKPSVCAVEVEGKKIKKPEECESILQVLQGIHEEGFLSDFNLRVGDRVFPVHRVILGFRSRVFRTMFCNELKDKEDNSVDISDMDSETLQRMLKFLYSNILDEDLSWAAASSLYAAAGNYALAPLKRGCSFVLKSGLCISNVLHALSLADFQQDEELKSAAFDFILSSGIEIVGTENWTRFEQDNAKLALETCRKLYLVKVKKKKLKKKICLI